MIIYKPTNKILPNRKAAKNYLGGCNNYNRALKNGLLLNLDNELISIANYETVYNDTERIY